MSQPPRGFRWFLSSSSSNILLLCGGLYGELCERPYNKDSIRAPGWTPLPRRFTPWVSLKTDRFHQGGDSTLFVLPNGVALAVAWQVGLGRIVGAHHRSSTLYQIR